MRRTALALLALHVVIPAFLSAQARTEKKEAPAAPRPTQGQVAEQAAVPPYRYEAKGRRDPFRTLDVQTSIQATSAPIVRPPGLKGQLVSELKLVGIVRTKDGPMAIVEGYRNRTFFMRPKDDLYDGKVLEIRPDRIVLSQTLTDSQGKTLTQQVTKKLYPTRGEGSDEK
ncbi:MAG: pilus assembly protein PilP [Acidobacteriota bacterium]